MIYEIKYNKLIKEVNTIKNACVALFCLRNNQLKIYLVQLRNNLWDIPGGDIKRNKKENSFEAALREFKEETGFNLKKYKNKMYFPSVTYGNPPHTRIYYHLSYCYHELNFIFKPNNETKDGRWFDVKYLPQLRHTRSILSLINFIERNKYFIL